MSFYFVPYVVPEPGTVMRMLYDLYRVGCTTCDRVGGPLAYMIRGDGEWDGSIVCMGETPCAEARVAGYFHNDTEPWTGPLPVGGT